ncbi:hypothetical protein BCV73_01300 [Paenibacillus sp. SSG-1]|uniref:hypothetical protein n=1 Tax=Paenibacillus sp. SSG-1 TaxID=1443669 RepID=UPI000B7DECAA|nr:hypothetical protein [Paenibacillus sp. SSG-1]OXL81855.1 hypothetical protein BCV73_01300 [Paenibacillus sp. SSG-1]
MKHTVQTVPYGYEPPVQKRKGTLIYYDTFEETDEEGLNEAESLAGVLSFSKLVLYPLHEETVRRMTKEPVSPYYKREKRLEAWRSDGHGKTVIENWEGRRKKYTPVEAALRHLTEKYPAPHFLLLTPDMANRFASYSTFGEWIVKLRLLLTEEPEAVHPKLEQYSHRWDTAQGAVSKQH